MHLMINLQTTVVRVLNLERISLSIRLQSYHAPLYPSTTAEQYYEPMDHLDLDPSKESRWTAALLTPSRLDSIVPLEYLGRFDQLD